jgi:hypothetical protein
MDEESPSDADYIYSDTDDDACRVGLSTVTDPESSSGHTVRWRWMSTGAAPPTELASAYLYQGATLRATLALEVEINRGSFEAKSYTLSAGEADAITDYSDLRVGFLLYRTAVGKELHVSWVEMEVPDAQTVTFYNNTAASGTVILAVSVDPNQSPYYLELPRHAGIEFDTALHVDQGDCHVSVWSVDGG